ncbi:gamma-glutamyl-gamma-aminobutyrate hydrolase family protein [Paucibacter sp. AS339]|uniref:gamma-glutamyl-gamma-aminobutyrate hydrolase family protein n=1 Tax=Paucibacter hankyongi TaxID=3133434 RepID=UPI003098B732
MPEANVTVTATTPGTAASQRKPVVLVPACNRPVGEHPFHIAGKKYIDAVRLAGCLPLIVPSSTPQELEELLALADGVLLTGSPSNVHPSHFDEAVHNPALPLDPERDAWTLALVPKALTLGMPLFAICRGFQEANVALGGSLHQAVQEQAGLNDHRAPEGQAPEQQYADQHRVQVLPGGLLAELLGRDGFAVNSLHGQGVKQLAPGLRIEAVAEDGLVEAFSHAPSAGFNLCVQWHPEWRAASNPVSMALLKAFGQACQDYQAAKQRLIPET